MEPLLVHVQENWKGYAAIGAVLLPVLYLTRRYTLPAIQWCVELAVYSAIFHVVLHYLVAVAAWFQYESQMKMLVQEKVHTGWETPLTHFWDRELYHPGWVFYFEVVVVIGIVAAMIRYRPMTTQKLGPKREVLRKGVTPSVRPPGASLRPKGH